ncbi:Imm49 family immunity protein [Streptomyces sp. NPDC020858]|uniref:Imm49 family immunity protein n=1 Tax=Streptomyces sp. NPDC020858 TaxID=3365097 RepID=UPI0037992729
MRRAYSWPGRREASHGRGHAPGAARTTELYEIPLERLRSADDAYEEFHYHWVDVQQTHWLRRPGLVDKLIAAIETSNPEDAHSFCSRDCCIHRSTSSTPSRARTRTGH